MAPLDSWAYSASVTSNVFFYNFTIWKFDLFWPDLFYFLFIFYKFSPNLLNGLICEVETRAKQSLLRRSWPLQSDREIPGNRQDLKTKFNVPT